MTLVKFNADKKNNSSLLPSFNDVFESILNDSFFNDRLVARVPAANISETEEHYQVELAAPGRNKDGFKFMLGIKANDVCSRRGEIKIRGIQNRMRIGHIISGKARNPCIVWTYGSAFICDGRIAALPTRSEFGFNSKVQ